MHVYKSRLGVEVFGKQSGERSGVKDEELERKKIMKMIKRLKKQ